MVTAISIGVAFLLGGLTLLAAARQILLRGTAVTDENDVIRRARQPARFSAFVIAQIVFGLLFAIAGCGLVLGAFLI
jgi:hypothetical protein